MELLGALLFLVALAPALAFRTKSGRRLNNTDLPAFSRLPPSVVFQRRQQLTVGAEGRVSSIYTFGSPAMSIPSLTYPASSTGCFPGVRVVAARSNWLMPQNIDMVAKITTPFGYEHPQMEQAKIFVQDGDKRDVKWAGCGEEWPDAQNELVDPTLHLRPSIYVNWGVEFSLGDITKVANQVALNISANKDRADVAASVGYFGWSLIGTALVNDPISFISDTVSHLIQEPETQSCMLTFRGSRSTQDWINNVQLSRAHFCGLVDEDEECSLFDNSCTTRKPDGAFVHKGFRDHFRSIISSDEWKANIMPHLPGCSEVFVVGHSLGGVAGSYFARCLAQNLQPGDYGYEDYEQIRWTVGQPRNLPPWSV